MREIYVPQKVDYVSEGKVFNTSIPLKSIYILAGSVFVSIVLGLVVYPKIRFLFYIYFVGLCHHLLKDNDDIHEKKNWQAYLLVLRRDTTIYH